MTPQRRRASRKRGQALVEFSLVLVPFLFILMGILDLGRGIYSNNGVAQAAREIARVTSVHPCNTGSCTLGNSSETSAVVTTQKGLVPGLADPSATIAFRCVDVRDQDVTHSTCISGDFVRVTVSVPFGVITPFLGLAGPYTLTSVSHVQLP
jgi:hypothetical protein